MPADGSARLPRVAPESVGMSVSRLAMIDDVVYRGIRAGGFPGAAVIVARHGGIVWERGYGTLDWRSGVAVDAERTMYDLASLTKVVATTAAAMVLVDQGKLRLDERVTHYLPTFSRRSEGASHDSRPADASIRIARRARRLDARGRARVSAKCRAGDEPRSRARLGVRVFGPRTRCDGLRHRAHHARAARSVRSAGGLHSTRHALDDVSAGILAARAHRSHGDNCRTRRGA